MRHARLLKRLDDFLFLDQLLDHALNVIIVPHRNLVIFWARERLEHERVLECKRTRNKLWVCKAKLSL